MANWNLSRRMRPVVVAIYVLFGLFVLAEGLLEPTLNWDILPYVGCVVALETSDTSEMHRLAYDRVRASVGSVLVATSLAYVISHFLLFPVLWERFFTGAYLMGTLGCCLICVDHKKGAMEQSRGLRL